MFLVVLLVIFLAVNGFVKVAERSPLSRIKFKQPIDNDNEQKETGGWLRFIPEVIKARFTKSYETAVPGRCSLRHASSLLM